MEKKKKQRKWNINNILIGALAFVLVFVLGGILLTVARADSNQSKITVQGDMNYYEAQGENGIGVTGYTQNTQTGRFNESADLYQNVQAISERMASTTQNYILQADSKGQMQTISPTSMTGTSTPNGLNYYITSGSFDDATTTLKCVHNPFGVTSTVDIAGFKLTGVPTSSFAITAATSTQTTGLTTSTPGFGVANAYQLLNVNLLRTTHTTNTVWIGGIVDVRNEQSQTTATQVDVTPSESVCFVAGEGNGGATGGLTSTTNLFAGTFFLRWWASIN